jgi:hypothetical protein
VSVDSVDSGNGASGASVGSCGRVDSGSGGEFIKVCKQHLTV